MTARQVSIIIGIVVLLVLVLALLAGPIMFMGGPSMMAAMRFNPFLWLSLLLFWALILGGVALFLAWFSQVAGVFSPPLGQSGRAAQILNERFARGEISREQYVQMRNEIEHPGSGDG